MKLWLARHADAGAYSSDPARERERPLTSLGVKQASAVARRMRVDGERPRVILASPLARAMETADIFGRVLGVRVEPWDDLTPNRELIPAVLELATSGARRVMLVGHQDNLDPLTEDRSGEGPKLFERAEVRRYALDRGSLAMRRRYTMTPAALGLPVRGPLGG
jgi:phosphohistidine phosphatase SixA